ncbi:MAG: hypothetical protein KJN71_04565 [Acidimicrobiia bacterium]|nr:hypothetical protein [Acidimicrobiia bacterium]
MGVEEVSTMVDSATEVVSADSVEAIEETWKTRPETWGAFFGNLFICLIFPIAAVWYVPKYAMRQEYVRAGLCLVVPIIAVVLVLTML